MPDRYQGLRDAIAAGPTRGPWKSMSVRSGYYIQSASEPAVVVDSTDAEGRYGAIANAADAALIAAADPATIAALLADNDRLRGLLAEAITEIDDWAAYAAPMFREKHDLEGTLSRFRAALADGEASNGS